MFNKYLLEGEVRFIPQVPGESNRMESNHVTGVAELIFLFPLPLMKKGFKQTPNRENKLTRAL